MTSSTTDELDKDALLKALEEEDDPAYRSDRIEQLRAEFGAAKERFSTDNNNNNTLYSTLRDDQSLLDFTTTRSSLSSSPSPSRCVVHFTHPDFARCSIMDDHLRLLASRHHSEEEEDKDGVRFARIDVRDCPFVVEKLNVRVLPCVIGFLDGVAVERIVGFEGLASGGLRDAVNGFRTVELERRLLRQGVLVKEKLGLDRRGEGQESAGGEEEEEEEEEGADKYTRGGERKHIRSGNNIKGNDDDDDDWD
ncbi:Thioredoxin-like fold [Elaphomyces granulatus]